MKHLLIELAALSMVGCAHAGPPVDLSPPPEALVPPPRPTIHHLRHYPTPPHPVARPVVPHPRPRVRVVPVRPQAPQEAPLDAVSPPTFDQRFDAVPFPQAEVRNVAPGVTGAPVEAPAPARLVPVSNEDAHRLDVALKILAGVLGMGFVAVLVGHRRNGH